MNSRTFETNESFPTEELTQPDQSATEEVSRFQKIREIFNAARVDFSKTNLKGKVVLAGLVTMGAYEWGPGNETVTPLLAGQALDIAGGVGGIAITAAVGGGFTYGQQLASGFLARRTSQEFPGVANTAYEKISEVFGSETENTGDDNQKVLDQESSVENLKPFKKLSLYRKILYSITLGSSYNVIREAAVTGETNEEELKHVSRASAAITGLSVAAISGGVDVANQHFHDEETVQFVIDNAVKNPFFWVGLMAATFGADYLKYRLKDRKDDSNNEFSGYNRSKNDLEVLTRATVSDERMLSINEGTNPDIGKMGVYKLDGNDERADVARTIETDVFEEDYGYSKEFMEETFGPYDKNSFFFLMIDHSDPDDPRPVGVLRVIECSKGDSETISMFREFYGEEAQLPKELEIGGKEKVWDIMTVAVKEEYRNGLNSAWLYHALYKQSVDEEVERWIANMTPNEFRNLSGFIGIPFSEIEGTGSVKDQTQSGETEEYGFYAVDVESIHDPVSNLINKIKEKTDPNEFDLIRGQVASIGLNGKKLSQ